MILFSEGSFFRRNIHKMNTTLLTMNKTAFDHLLLYKILKNYLVVTKRLIAQHVSYRTIITF